ncbi:MAG: Gldg family protein [Alphaproteobacteria bacterium]|nr:Gldg family protein [Alphaproteobacteria bacterium]MCB9793497.1 Gldg family protein [Alphaproteobacteria bacterium]
MALSRQTQRRLAYGGNATLVTAIVIALVVVLYGVADRNRARVDFSADGDNELQADTLRKLQLLDTEGEEVEVVAFTAQEGKSDSYFKNRALKDLMLELDYRSKVVDAKLVDFDRERLTAESLGVTEYGHLVVRRGDERVDIRARELFRSVGKGPDRRLEFLGEAAFNRAASQILSKRRQVIYALRGHGELDVEEAGPSGLSDLAALLDQENYELKPLDFFRDRDGGEAPFIPADASGVLLARPRAALTQAEEDALVAYVANGGAVMLLTDPHQPLPWLMERLNVTVPEGVVMDRLRVFPYNDRPVPTYGRHSIVNDLREERIVTMVAHAAAVRLPEPAPEWMKASEVLTTTRDGWIDKGGELEAGAAVYEPEIDLAGPVTMAAALELQPQEGSLVNVGKRVARVLIVGDSDLMTNALLAEGPGNTSFAVNAFRWLVWDDARLSMVGRPTRVRRLALTEEDQGRIRWVVLGLLPMLSLVLGAAVWSSRRGR